MPPLVVACLVGVLSSQSTPSLPAGTVTGRVVEAETRAPVPNATVRLFPFGGGAPRGRQAFEVVTDDSGRYIFENVPALLYRVSIRAEGFATPGVLDLPDVNVRAGQDREVVDIVLQREAVIAGRVVDETGGPLTEG